MTSCSPLRLPWDISSLVLAEAIQLAQLEARQRFVDGNEGKHDDGHWVVYSNLRAVCKDWQIIADSLFFRHIVVPSDSSFLRLFYHLSLSPHFQTQTRSLMIRSNGYWDLLETSAQSLSPLLRLFPNLERLSLGVTFYCVRPQRTFLIPSNLKVGSDTVYLREYEGPMNALLRSEACSRLERVDITSTQDNQTLILPPTVRHLSVHLSLDYHLSNLPTSPPSSSSFFTPSTSYPGASLPRLQSLTLSNLTPAGVNSTTFTDVLSTLGGLYVDPTSEDDEDYDIAGPIPKSRLQYLTLNHSSSLDHGRARTTALSLPSTVLSSCPDLCSLSLSSQLMLDSVPSTGHSRLRSLDLPVLPSASFLPLYRRFLPALETITFPSIPIHSPPSSHTSTHASSPKSPFFAFNSPSTSPFETSPTLSSIMTLSLLPG